MSGRESELRSWSPLWLEESGLPELVAEKSRGAAAWAIFKKVVELDCALHTEPGTVEITPADLADRAGVPRKVCRKTLIALRKLKLIEVFVPDDDAEEALARVKVPLRPPLGREAIEKRLAERHGATSPYLRYLDSERPKEDEREHDPVLSEVIDLYFNAIGLRMNVFVLDELRLIRKRFPIGDIRRVFGRARQNEIRSLPWIVRELVRANRRREEKPEDSRA